MRGGIYWRIFISGNDLSKRISVLGSLQVHGSVKALFLTTTSVATLGGLASLGFLAVVWSSRYVYFQAGLRPSLGDQSKGVPDVYEQYSSGDPPTS